MPSVCLSKQNKNDELPTRKWAMYWVCTLKLVFFSVVFFFHIIIIIIFSAIHQIIC